MLSESDLFLDRESNYGSADLTHFRLNQSSEAAMVQYLYLPSSSYTFMLLEKEVGNCETRIQTTFLTIRIRYFLVVQGILKHCKYYHIRSLNTVPVKEQQHDMGIFYNSSLLG
jgi:hypothetical protein